MTLTDLTSAASPDSALTPRSGRVRRGRRLAVRASRARAREFLAEGPQAVREALGHDRAGQLCHEVYAAAAATARHPDLLAAAQAVAVPWTVVDDEVLAALSDTVAPQGVVARCGFLDRPLAELLASPPRLVAVCADVRDPGNAGTVIRCADAAGAGAVVVSGESVDPYNPKAVRASAGSLFHVDLAVEADTVEVVRRLRSAGIQVLAADAHADLDLDDALDDGLLVAPTAWLLGNEAHGLSDALRAEATHVVSVPLHGRAESLNLATAAAVCLYASARAHRRPVGAPA